ncbi:hypothetical protein YBT020_05475 [Bacillus thuringiensis serovar finitimus YBT-020]|nr:hypothetical protein YBT020_05475 [Bacillus thuringiensis serovar finitimus YBT-020]
MDCIGMGDLAYWQSSDVVVRMKRDDNIHIVIAWLLVTLAMYLIKFGFGVNL